MNKNYSLSVSLSESESYKKEKRETEVGAGYWNDAPSLRKSINAAFKFMNGEPILRNLIAITSDPFTSLSKLPATALDFSDDEQD